MLPQHVAMTEFYKQMGCTMSATLKDATASKEDKTKSYEQLIAKTGDETKRIGDFGVKNNMLA